MSDLDRRGIAHLCSQNKGAAQLICVFVFAYAKSRFSHDKAHFKDSFETLIDKIEPHLVKTCLPGSSH